MGIIANGKNTPINVKTGTVPDVSGAMRNWYQPLTFSRVVKTISDFQVIETMTQVAFRGVVMPLDGRQLMLKPEGQRVWNWINVFSDIALGLSPDDVINFLGKQYRVMSQKNYALYGYLQYELVSDWTGSGPEVV